jgi:putative transposase
VRLGSEHPYGPVRETGCDPEALAIHVARSIDADQTIIEDWRQDYNAHRPHSALGNLSPNAFANAHRARPTESAEQSGISS